MKEAVLIIGLVVLVLLSGCAEITEQGKLKAEEAEELAYLDPDHAVGVCDEIEDAYSRNRCYLGIVQIIAKFNTSKAEEICDRTESVYLIDRTKDKCYFAVASNLNPNYPSEAERVCGKMSIFSWKQADACPVMAGWLYGNITDEEAAKIEEYAVSVADKDWIAANYACEVTGMASNRCLSRAAVAGRDAYLCSFIEDDSEYSIDGCARSIAPLCASVQDVNARDDCYLQAQIQQSTADISLCEKIEAQDIRDGCYWNATQKETVSPEIPEETYKYCEQDSDCISVSGGCCGCTGGGVDNISINKRYKDYWDSRLKCGPEVMCPAVMSNHWTCVTETEPRCVNNRCELVEKPEEKQMSAGETFTISDLACGGGTGYEWQITKIDGNLLELVGQDYQSSCAEPMPGCGGTCFFTFEALKEGSTELEMVYCRSWECEETTFETKRVTVSIS